MSATEAADWLQRLDNPLVSEAELHGWLEWFDSSDENRKAFEDMQSVYLRLRGVAGDYRPEIREKLGLPLATSARTPQRGLRLSPPLRALAASLILAAGGLSAWWNVHGVGRELTYSAPIHQHKSVALADGSALVLGAGSTASVQFTDRQRAVTIERGEAYFEVHHDVHRPFVVQAGGVRVVAVGTAFNVQRDRDQVIVTVTEGVVEVQRAPTVQISAEHQDTAPLRVAVGQRTVIPTAVPPSQVSTASHRAASDWRDGRIEFINVPLSAVLAVVNRETATKFVIDDPRVADLTYSGTILKDHLDEWAASLPRIYPVRSVALEDGTVSLVSGARADFVR